MTGSFMNVVDLFYDLSGSGKILYSSVLLILSS